MELAGVRTGAFMATAVVDGSTAVQIRTSMRAATRPRCHSAPTFLRAAAIGHSRSAVVTHQAVSLRAASRPRYLRDPAFLIGPYFLSSASAGHSTDTTAYRRYPRAASEGTEITPAETDPKASPSCWDKIVGLLSGNIFKLVLLGVSVVFGFMAAKDYQFAVKTVEVCDKTHKMYNILSKALPIILALLKGDA